MKAFSKIIAVAIAAAGVATVAGCAGSTPSAKTVTNANWNVRTSTSVEKNFTERWLSHREVAVYSISLAKGNNGTYSVAYDEGGYYKTEFGMAYFDWGDVEGLPEGYAPAEITSEIAYVYKTEMKLSGTYTLTKSGEKVNFEDSVESVCYYRLACDNLQPIYSYQVIKNTAPNALNAATVESMYIKTDDVYTTFYNANCTKATIVHKDNLKTDDAAMTEVRLTSKEGYSLFDNSQLRAAVRAFNISGIATHIFNVLVPQNGGIQACAVTSTTPAELDSENEAHKLIIDALDNCDDDYIFFDKGEGDKQRNYRYNAVTMGLYVDSAMTGSSPTFWYSTVENSEINYTRCVLLRMSTPLSFGLGTLNYTLSSLNLQPNE